MKWFYDMTIRTKLLSSFILITFLSAAIGYAGIAGVSDLAASARYTHDNMVVPLIYMNDITRNFQRIRIAMRDVQLSEKAEDKLKYADKIKSLSEEIDKSAKLYEGIIFDETDKANLKEFIGAKTAYMLLVDRIIELSAAGKRDEAETLMRGDAYKAGRAGSASITKIVGYNLKVADDMCHKNNRKARTITTIIISFSVIGLSLALSLGVFIAVIVSRPIKKLADATKRIGEGNFERIAGEQRRDEAGILTASFNKMADDIAASQRTLNESIDELNASNQRFELLSEASFEGILVINDDGRIIDYNKRSAEMFGYAPGEMLNRPVFDIVTPQYHEIVIKHMSEGCKCSHEIDCLKKDGMAIIVEVNGHTMEYKGHRIKLWALRDMTDYHAMNQDFRLQSEMLMNMAEGVVLIKISDGSIVYATPKFNDMFGYEEGELTGKNISIVNAPTDVSPEDMADQIHSQLRQTGSWQGEILNVKKDGTLFWCHAIVFPFTHNIYGTVWISVHNDITEHKRMEMQLRENEERFRATFEFSTIGIAITSPEKGWIKVNDEICRITGYSHEELTGMTWAELTHTEDLQPETIEFNRILAGETDGYKLEKRLIRKDGEVVYTMLWVNCKRCENGKVDYCIAMLEDVTESRKTAEALRIEIDARRMVEKRLSLLLDATFEGVSVSENGRIIAANKRLAEMYGYDYEEVIGMPVVDTITPQYREILMKHISEGYDKPYELECLKKDGTIMTVEACGKTLEYNGHRIRLAAVRDITQRKQTEVALRQSEEKFRNLFDASLDALFIVDVNGNFIDFNKTAHERLGYTKEEMMSIRLSELDTPEFAAMLSQRIAYMQKHGEGVFESAHVKKDGSVMFVEINAMMIDFDGKKAMFSIIRDITQRKGMELQLKKLNANLQAMVIEETEKRRTHEQILIQQSKMAAMGEMIGLIAHQWRQPLNIIGITVQDIKEAYQYGELNEKYINMIVETAKSQVFFMSKTIDDFRNFFNPSKEKVCFDVKTAIDELLAMYPEHPPLSVHWSCRTEADIPL
ncbi:MAG: PAS domain S-box protein [Nitrospirae bacterium]|nr:PAS domain S-box protein [Nitrospirota bacterium]